MSWWALTFLIQQILPKFFFYPRLVLRHTRPHHQIPVLLGPYYSSRCSPSYPRKFASLYFFCPTWQKISEHEIWLRCLSSFVHAIVLFSNFYHTTLRLLKIGNVQVCSIFLDYNWEEVSRLKKLFSFQLSFLSCANGIKKPPRQIGRNWQLDIEIIEDKLNFY